MNPSYGILGGPPTTRFLRYNNNEFNSIERNYAMNISEGTSLKYNFQVSNMRQKTHKVPMKYMVHVSPTFVPNLET